MFVWNLAYLLQRCMQSTITLRSCNRLGATFRSGILWIMGLALFKDGSHHHPSMEIGWYGMTADGASGTFHIIRNQYMQFAHCQYTQGFFSP